MVEGWCPFPRSSISTARSLHLSSTTTSGELGTVRASHDSCVPLLSDCNTRGNEFACTSYLWWSPVFTQRSSVPRIRRRQITLGSSNSYPLFASFDSTKPHPPCPHARDTIVAVWAAPVAAESERSFAFHVLGAGGGLVANLRSQILSRGLSGVSAFRRGVRNARSAGGTVGAEELTQEGFHSAVRLVGADLTVSILVGNMVQSCFCR